MGEKRPFTLSLLLSFAFFSAGAALPMLGVQSVPLAVILLVTAFILLVVAAWIGLGLPVPRFPQRRQLFLPDGSLPEPPSKTKVVVVVAGLCAIYALAVASQWVPQLEPVLAVLMAPALVILFVGYPILGFVLGVRWVWFWVRRRPPLRPTLRLFRQGRALAQ